MKLVALLSTLVMQLQADSKETIPTIYAVVEDDYPYQCICKCTGDIRIATCEFDKTTPCYCDAPAASAATTTAAPTK